jgi:malate dehydrogenase (quinone)
MLESKSAVGLVNSNPFNNAQTGHIGDKETNYNLLAALKMRHRGILMRNYLLQSGAPGLFKRGPGMVLAVDQAEVETLEQRFEEFRAHYPDLTLIRGQEIGDVEPMVMLGRTGKSCALLSESYTINYQRLAQCFIEDSKAVCPGFVISFNTALEHIERIDGGYYVRTNTGEEIIAKVVMFAAGSYSLHYAHKLGYANNLGILAVKADFFTSKRVLNGKVYRVQDEGNPWARIHADSDITDSGITRYGPTTKPVPFMEPRHFSTIIDYLKQPTATPKGIWVLGNILIRRNLVGYVAENLAYGLPLVGPHFFAKPAQEIIPTITAADLHIRPNAGGIRPQIVDMDTWKLEMGERKIVGIGDDHFIADTTPSPGASSSLANGETNVAQITEWLGPGYFFDRVRFNQRFGDEKVLRKAA